jgi:acyl-coenzyme A thioesterase PaaI-like protein
MEKGGKSLISAYYLGDHYTGYFNIIHGGIMAALINQISAEYCLRASLTLYALTKTLFVDFKKPSPPRELFIAKVSSL